MNTSSEPDRRPVRAAGRRQRSLPATGLPAKREDRRGSGLVSLLLHALLIALLITPLASHDGLVARAGPKGQGALVQPVAVEVERVGRGMARVRR